MSALPKRELTTHPLELENQRLRHALEMVQIKLQANATSQHIILNRRQKRFLMQYLEDVLSENRQARSN